MSQNGLDKAWLYDVDFLAGTEKRKRNLRYFRLISRLTRVTKLSGRFW
jgi:hypothetical protein